MAQWMGHGWEPQRTYRTPRGDREGNSAPQAMRDSSQAAVARHRRVPDPGPDLLSGQRNRGDSYGGGARWDSTPGRSWDGEAPLSQRASEPPRAVAPHRRPAKEVTGKVTGEPNGGPVNHRALNSDRTMAPYRRDPTIAVKISDSAHPAYRREARSTIQSRPAGATSKDLAEHAVQAEYVATELDVGRASAKNKSHTKFQHAHGLSHGSVSVEDPDHRGGWTAAVKQHRAFDGAYGATTGESNLQYDPNGLEKRRVVKGREAHEQSVGRVVFNESDQKHRSRIAAAEHRAMGGGGAYKEESAFAGAAGLDSSDARQVRNRERWQTAHTSKVKGVGEPPSEVFRPSGGVVHGGRPAAADGNRSGSLGSARGAEARRSAYYERHYESTAGGTPAGVKTQHQTGNDSASASKIQQGVSSEVGSAMGNGVKAVNDESFAGAFGMTSRQVNSSDPQLKSSLSAEGAIVGSAGTEYGGERQGRFGTDVPEVVFGAPAPTMPKAAEVPQLVAGRHAGADTHTVNRRELNSRYHDRGRYGHFGAAATPDMDATTDSVGEVLFSALKPKDFEKGAGPLAGSRGTNKRLDGAAGMASSAMAEGEPLMRYRAPPDQTERQRATSEANAGRSAEFNFAPQVEGVVFNGINVSTLGRAGPRGELYNHRATSPRRAPRTAAEHAEAATARASSPRGQSPSRGGGTAGRSPSPRGAGGGRASPRCAWGAPQSQPLNSRMTNAAGTTTHELAQKDFAFGGPGGPDHVRRAMRSGLPNQAVPGPTSAAAVLAQEQLAKARQGKRSVPPNQDEKIRSQAAYVEAAGASSQEVEQQLYATPFERSKVRGGQAAALAALRGQGAIVGSRRPSSANASAYQAPPPSAPPANGGPQLFERDSSRRSAAGMSTGRIAASEPAFLLEGDAGLKLFPSHPSRCAEVVFNKRPSRKFAEGNLEDAPEYKGRYGIPSHKYGARDPLLIGDCPPGNESKAASTWKSQLDEVLYGTDMDGSGDLASMDKAITSAPQYQGAAGVSSLAHAHDAPEVRVDVNTRIDMTYAVDAGVPAKGHKPGSPIQMPMKEKHLGWQPPELFAKAGVAGWMCSESKNGAQVGKDEAWRPWHGTGAFIG